MASDDGFSGPISHVVGGLGGTYAKWQSLLEGIRLVSLNLDPIAPTPQKLLVQFVVPTTDCRVKIGKIRPRSKFQDEKWGLVYRLSPVELPLGFSGSSYGSHPQKPHSIPVTISHHTLNEQ